MTSRMEYGRCASIGISAGFHSLEGYRDVLGVVPVSASVALDAQSFGIPRHEFLITLEWKKAREFCGVTDHASDEKHRMTFCS